MVRWCSLSLTALLAALALFSPACQAGSKAKAGFPNYRWEPIGLSGGGGMFAPGISPIDPDLMMVNCDMSGAYITNDGGRHWTLIHQRQLRSSTSCRPGFHPKDANIIYACDGATGRLKMSKDRGVHWSFVGDFYPDGEIALDPEEPSLMLAGSGEAVSLSRDAGRTWTKCEGPAGRAVGFFFDRTSPADARVMFAATENGLWRSQDGGQTWEQAMTGLVSPEIKSFAGGADPKTGTVMLYCSLPSVIKEGRFTGGVYRSRDRGDTWESAMHGGINTQTVKSDEYGDGDIAQYPFVLTTNTKPLTVYAFNTSTAFHPPYNPGVYRSDDGGETWRQTMYMDPRFKGQFNRQEDYFTAAQGRSDQSGAFGAAIAQSNPEVVMHLGGICFVTHNGGQTWEAAHTLLAPGQKPVPGSAWLCNGLVVTTTWHYYIDPFQPNRHYIAYTDIGWARSLDAGKSWIWWPQEKWTPWSNTCYEIAFDPQIKGKMWGTFSNTHDIPNSNIIGGHHRANLPGGVCVSTDFGDTWKVARSGEPHTPCTSIVLDPKSKPGARTLYAGFFDDGVYKSTDDGKTWARKSHGLGAPANMRVYRLILHKDGTLFALITAKREGGKFLANGTGIYRSTDGAETWESISSSVGFRWPKDFAVDPKSSKVIFVGAANGGEEQTGLWRTADGGETWKRLSQQGPEHFGAYLHPQRPGWIYMTLTEGPPGPSLWLSIDNGVTWRALDTFPFSNAQRVEFDPKDPDTIYVTTFGASVWRGKAQQPMAIRQRKAKRKPPRISYEEFRNAVSGSECCAGAAGGMITELAVRIARQMEGTAPAAMLEELLGQQENVSVHGVWHHVLVGELLLTALRNAGYPISEALLDEVIDRGRQIPGGSCGFLGTCGALASAASAYAILLGSTPVALDARERLLAFHARLQTRLAEIGGSRCCKKSSYAALEFAQAEFAALGFALPAEEFTGRCVFCAENETCDGPDCPYSPGR